MAMASMTSISTPSTSGDWPRRWNSTERRHHMIPGLDDTVVILEEAYGGRTDKAGQPLILHAQAVAEGVESFGTTVQLVGLLHDALEDTDLTATDLLDMGYPITVVHHVQALTRRETVSYDTYLDTLCMKLVPTIVKIADNAHNSQAERLQLLDPFTESRLTRKYARARARLYPKVHPDDVAIILARLNPALIAELNEMDPIA